MKIYNTKYALTKGILEQQGELVGEDMVQIGAYTSLHGEGKDWHRSRDSAMLRAEFMRERKISSLERSLKRIKEMVF